MASIGHIAVGMVAGRLYQRDESKAGWKRAAPMALWSALSMLPDADVIGFRFGVRYAEEWGHRGASHSLAFALLTALGVSFLGRLWRQDATRTFVFAWIVITSHSLLDTLTDGGLGCALFWPWSSARLFAPWNPIPVAPIGLRFLSSAGLLVAAVELALFSPLFAYALWPKKRG
jgi:inner membrane protein